MRSLETTGRTVEEAVNAALEQLGIDRQQAEIEILEEPARGLFGLLGPRQARVRVTAKRSKAEFVKEFIQEVCQRMGLAVPTVEVQEGEQAVEVQISGPDVGLLIGRRGRTLQALQFLTNLAAGRASRERKRVVIDVEGYRRRRAQSLERIARHAAQRARRTGRRVALEPMSAAERRAVHLALQSFQGIRTESEGEEPFRRVVIMPATPRRHEAP